jgi:hypothetical protein
VPSLRLRHGGRPEAFDVFWYRDRRPHRATLTVVNLRQRALVLDLFGLGMALGVIAVALYLAYKAGVVRA